MEKKMSKKQWRCYFCDEIFTDKHEAAKHFGVDESCEADEVACKLMSHQKKVVEYIRDLEAEVRRLQSDAHNESHPLLRSLYDLQDEMNAREKSAEERGYTKGVNDMKSQGYCMEPSKHELT